MCCKKIAHVASPPVKSLRLFGKRFLCLSLVLLHYDVGFPEFPHHPSVLNKKPEFVSESLVDVKTKIMHKSNIAQHLSLALVVSGAMPRAQLLNSRGGDIYNHPTEVMVGRRMFVVTLY